MSVLPVNHEPFFDGAWLVVPDEWTVSQRVKPGSALDRGSPRVRTQQSFGLDCGGTVSVTGYFFIR